MNTNNYSIREPGFEGLLIGVVQQAVDDYVFWNVRKQSWEDLKAQIQPLKEDLAMFIEGRDRVRKEIRESKEYYDNADIVEMYETIDKWTERIDKLREEMFPMRRRLSDLNAIRKKAEDAEEFLTSDFFCETFSITKNKIMAMCNELVNEMGGQNDE